MIKNITLSAEEALIQQARRQASMENVTLNELFRRWLERYTMQAAAAERYTELMDRLSYAKPTHKYSREEMNERH